MSKRASRKKSEAVGLFPFLAVLLCTMGALLVVLVVLAQRAAEHAVSGTTAEQKPVEQPTPPPSPPAASPAEVEEVANLKYDLDQILQYQEQIQKRRKDAEKQLEDEKAKLSHLEEHSRRLEHELARLSLAADQLTATENNQSVDQQQAESQLERLKSLIDEGEKQLEELREQGKGKRSYAIVPYKGPNGTFRKPVYIECCKEGIILHPEGIHFPETDFVDPKWPGNPLAAALRATREYLNNKAAQAGEPEPPDPYPLLLVRPDGVEAYAVARAAITSWDSDYGYEFIAGEWKLDFPDLPDPVLAQHQHHAILNARDKMAVLARAAPSRFRGMGAGGRSAYGYGGNSKSTGYGSGGESDSSDPYGSLASSATGGSPNGNGLAAGQAAAHYTANTPGSQNTNAAEQSDTQYGALASNSPGGQADGFQSAYNEIGQSTANGGDQSSYSGSAVGSSAGPGQHPAGQQFQGQASATQSGVSGSAASAMAQNGSQGQASAAGSASSAAGSSSAGSSSSVGSSAASAMATMGQQGQQQQTPSATISNQQPRQASSIADSQGSNWAIQQGRSGAVPIRRPIEVVVRQNQIALLPSRHALEANDESGAVISLNQSIPQISEQFVQALRSHVQEWGLAGNGLYWRPVLELKVGPNAQQTAHDITRLLQDSGVEVRLPEMANAGQGATTSAPK